MKPGVLHRAGGDRSQATDMEQRKLADCSAAKAAGVVIGYNPRPAALLRRRRMPNALARGWGQVGTTPPDPEDPFGLRGRGQGARWSRKTCRRRWAATTTRRCSRQKPWHRLRDEQGDALPKPEERVLRGLDQPDARPRRRQPAATRAAWWSWRRGSAYCVTACSCMQIDREVASPIMARDWKDPPVIGQDPRHTVSTAPASHRGERAVPHERGGEVSATLVAEGPGAVSARREGTSCAA